MTVTESKRDMQMPDVTTEQVDSECMILSKNICLGIDTLKTKKNLNTIVYGDDSIDAYFSPNIRQTNMSYIVVDEDGGLYKIFGDYLRGKGYIVDALSTVQCRKSDIVEEASSYGYERHAMFLTYQHDVSEKCYQKIAEIIDEMIPAIEHREPEKYGRRHTVHTAFLIPNFERLPVIGILKSIEKRGALYLMRKNQISLNIGVPDAVPLMDLYKDEQEIMKKEFDVKLYLGEKGWEAWRKTWFWKPREETRWTDEQCLVMVRGEHLYRDKKYNVL